MPSSNLPVIDQVSSALSVATLRHQVISNNIANRDTQGYQRLKVEFDRALAGSATPSSVAPSQGAGRVAVVVDRSAGPTSMEEDMVALSSNAMSYQALTKTLSRYFSILAAVTNNGKG